MPLTAVCPSGEPASSGVPDLGKLVFLVSCSSMLVDMSSRRICFVIFEGSEFRLDQPIVPQVLTLKMDSSCQKALLLAMVFQAGEHPHSNISQLPQHGSYAVCFSLDVCTHHVPSSVAQSSFVSVVQRLNAVSMPSLSKGAEPVTIYFKSF